MKENNIDIKSRTANMVLPKAGLKCKGQHLQFYWAFVQLLG